MASEIFGRQRECRFYTAGWGNKMAGSVTGPRAANELSGPVIPGTSELDGDVLNAPLTYQVGDRVTAATELLIVCRLTL